MRIVLETWGPSIWTLDRLDGAAYVYFDGGWHRLHWVQQK